MSTPPHQDRDDGDHGGQEPPPFDSPWRTPIETEKGAQLARQMVTGPLIWLTLLLAAAIVIGILILVG